jgi:hypothetical protein
MGAWIWEDGCVTPGGLALASCCASLYDGRTPRRGYAVPDYDLLRDHLSKQTLDEFVLSMEAIEEILDDALPRASFRASWWETERAPDEKMPQREACIAAGYIATRLPDGSGVRFRKKSAKFMRKWV